MTVPRANVPDVRVTVPEVTATEPRKPVLDVWATDQGAPPWFTVPMVCVPELSVAVTEPSANVPDVSVTVPDVTATLPRLRVPEVSVTAVEVTVQGGEPCNTVPIVCVPELRVAVTTLLPEVTATLPRNSVLEVSATDQTLDAATEPISAVLELIEKLRAELCPVT